MNGKNVKLKKIICHFIISVYFHSSVFSRHVDNLKKYLYMLMLKLMFLMQKISEYSSLLNEIKDFNLRLKLSEWIAFFERKLTFIIAVEFK